MGGKERRRPGQLQQDLSDSRLSPTQSFRAYPHAPKARESLLDEEGVQGVINLLAVLSAGWSCYRVYDNFERSGRAVDWTLFRWMMNGFHYELALWLLFVALAFFCHFIVRVLMRSALVPRTFTILLYTGFQFFFYATPVYLINFIPPTEMSILMRMALMMQVCVLSFKMHSYFMTNRAHQLHGNSGEVAHRDLHETASRIDPAQVYSGGIKVKYPNNLTLGDYTRFLCYPTLVYELNFPRTRSIRWWYVAQEWCVACFTFFILYLLLAEQVYPVLLEMHSSSVVELFARLGLPSLMAWLLLFYGIFHCGLNGLAELLMYADREFYTDWWNAKSMDQFWNHWNRAVYKWMARHVYVESQRVLGVGSSVAALLTFVTTAVLHEYVITGGFGALRPWMFYMIHLQIPFLYLTKMPFFRRSRWGNISMWVGFLCGLPLLLVLYLREKLAPQNAVLLEHR